MNSIIEAITEAKKTRNIYMQWAKDVKAGNAPTVIRDRKNICSAVHAARYWSKRLVRAKIAYNKSQLLLF